MRGLSPLLALAAAVVAAAPAVAADTTITFSDFAYNPTPATVKTGDTATFSGSFSSHPLVWDNGAFATTTMGTARAFSFSQPGTYSYHCQFHATSRNMVGTLTVVADQHPARVAFAVTPAQPVAGQAVTFTYTGDTDPDGTLTSWQWDLDGDGSLETTTPVGSATKTYAGPATVTVRMRAIDDSGEPSATAEQAVTIGAAASGPGAGGSAGTDTTAPRATLVKLTGLKLSFHSSEPATATATLRAGGKTIARGSAKAGTTSIRLRLTAAGRARLHRGHKLRVTLTLKLRDPSGNARTLTRRVTVRRP
jgi:plastocyanin